jgi:RNA polymerase sigma factor (sigma-70 family)
MKLETGTNKKHLFSKLYSDYAQKMRRLCMHYSSCESEADDLFHDAFFKVMKNYDDCRDKDNPGGWIKRITINTAMERFRKKKYFWKLTIRYWPVRR